MLRQSLLATAALGAMMAAAPRAEAVVTYTLVDRVYTFNSDIPEQSQRTPFNLSFSVSDAAVARGSINLSIRGGAANATFPPQLFGDALDLVSATIGIDPTLTPQRTIGRFDLRATFLPDGTITSSALELGGDRTDAQFSGTSALFAGRFIDDAHPGCGYAAIPICNVSGRLAVSVPEPMSLALLGVGLLGMTFARRRG